MAYWTNRNGKIPDTIRVHGEQEQKYAKIICHAFRKWNIKTGM